ncbi:MAG: cyclase family protein [Bacteroidota bacterium]
MLATIQLHGQHYQFNLSAPIDISIPLKEGLDTVNCFYAPLMETAPVVAGSFIGSTQEGGAVNFLNVKLNPHGNGTHTECVGHIAKEPYTINQSLRQFHFAAILVSIFPQRQSNGDRVILKQQLEEVFPEDFVPEAFIIRTMPNDNLKLKTNYSGANPPYLDAEAIAFLVDRGIKHLLVDLPSVDREEDGGKLLAHRAFWQYPAHTRTDCTISELIYIDNKVKDGHYLLNIQIASFEIDVSPSKPILYKLIKI